MKTKYLASVLVLSMLLAVIPTVFAGTHPCEATFEAKVNGKTSYTGTTLTGVTLKEPGLGGSTFTVEVWIENVVDLYAYEFTLNWNDTSIAPYTGGPYIELDDYAVDTSYWANSVVVLPDVGYAQLIGDPSLLYYPQVAAAIAPSTGFTGSAKLATLTFTIINDPVWVTGQNSIVIRFWFTGMKASGSCSNQLAICNQLIGQVTLKAIQPKIYMVPNYEENCQLPGKFTKTVWVANITKMDSLCFNLTWNTGDAYVGAWKSGDQYYSYAWPQVIVEKVKILVGPIDFTDPNYDVEWGPNVDVVVSPSGGTVHIDYWVYVCFKLKPTPYADLLNGTFPVVEITFEKQDPWYCGRQPLYYFDQPHETFTYPCITDFWFQNGVIDVECGGTQFIYFGTIYGDTRASIIGTAAALGYAVYFDYLQGNQVDFTCNMYIFTAVPGDLNLDGKVDITDVMIEAAYYGAPYGTYPNMYYDLNGDHVIDIYDLVIVSKNFGRVCTVG
jgi:hypothetical protein